jgi:hypothetical protein
MAVAADSHSQNQQLSLFGEGRLALSKRGRPLQFSASADVLAIDAGSVSMWRPAQVAKERGSIDSRLS